MTMSNSIQRDSREEVIDLGRIFGILIDHKWLIVSVTLFFTLCGITYGMMATPIYQGDALVQVERRSTVSPLGDLRNVLGESNETNTSAEVQILLSRMVLGQVVDRLGQDTTIQPVTVPIIGEYIVRRGIKRPEFPLAIPYIGDYVLRSGIPQPDFMKRLPYVWGGESIEVGRFELAEQWHGQDITVERDIGTRYQVLINGQPVGSGALREVSTFLDNQLLLRIDAFDAPPGVQFTLNRRHRASAIGSIGGRLEVAEVGGRSSSTGMLRLTMTGPDPEEILRSLDAVAETFLTQNVERQSAQAEQSLAFLGEQVPELRSQLTQAEQKLNGYRAELDSVDLSSEAQAAIQRYIDIEGRLNELEFQEAELAQRYTSSHPSYQTLLRQKRHLEGERAELNARVNELPAAQQEVVRMTRDVEVTQAIYVNVLNKVQELEVAKAGTIGNVRIIDRAQLSGLIAPRKRLIVILATLLGLMIAIGSVMLRSLLRQGVESPDQIEAAGLPVYAAIPFSNHQQSLERRVKKRGSHSPKEIMAGVLADRDPTDVAVEAIRGLRTSLHFVMLEGRNNRLMITGPSPGVGKSFVCINLSAVAAKAGMRVLLIDADLRKGQIHHAFGKQSADGLADYLAGQVSLDDIIQPTGIDDYWLITRGTAPPNPSELLMHPRFAETMQQLGERFDLVIIDTPPVLAVTDASVVGNHCDTTLLVARFETNSVNEILAAKRRLESNGLEVQGVILNAMERRASSAAGQYGGYYFYQYR
ncbi:tyrosine-protein kinase [Halomonas heilongjiangensis]|uniref:Tyrosine-protein kinase n=2 Tax=Halomonas heilongjiangensis TaxID=1387883 RepID=A0A2N7TUL7_9GAMM|nr:tyrosine-protein kinase [Halomonas heilongjiangensis]PXX87663.1 tyrosine-protein kinase [Halomonas heilongjiangensis]